MSRRIADSTFVIAAHGNESGPPASGVWRYLAERAKRVDVIYHPLLADCPPSRRHMIFERGRKPRRRTQWTPNKPPYSYPIDAVFPLRPPRADGWIAFNNLLAARGVFERSRGRVGKAVYWAVDFVPERFGESPITRAFDAVDRWTLKQVDWHVELSRPAIEGRYERHGLEPDDVQHQVVPVGAWLDGVPTTPEDGHTARRIVFIGHLVPRMGLDLGLEALALLAQRGVAAHLDVAGHGEHEPALRAKADELGIADRITWHGFVGDPQQLSRILADSSIALAPYEPDPSSFTRYADPSKPKSYLAAGLPILVTDVPPNAHDLAEHAGAQVLPYEARPWADAIERMLDDPADWKKRRADAIAYAQGFDWNVLLDDAFERMGFVA